MTRRFSLTLALGLFAMAGMLSIASAQGDGWGDITGRITYGGPKIPAPAFLDLKANPDKAACGMVRDESWIVNPKNKGLRDVFLWLEPVEKGGKLPIHPNLAKGENKPVVIDQPACAFIAHAVALREGQDLVAKNSSGIAHNFKWTGNPMVNPGGNVLLPPGAQKIINGLAADRLPISIECNVHPWMKGYVRVFDHPYFAVTDEDGKFTFKNAPAGDFKLKIWHNSGWLGGKDGRNGRPITIKAGENKLEDLPFPPPADD